MILRSRPGTLLRPNSLSYWLWSRYLKRCGRLRQTRRHTRTSRRSLNKSSSIIRTIPSLLESIRIKYQRLTRREQLAWKVIWNNNRQMATTRRDWRLQSCSIMPSNDQKHWDLYQMCRYLIQWLSRIEKSVSSKTAISRKAEMIGI